MHFNSFAIFAPNIVYNVDTILPSCSHKKIHKFLSCMNSIKFAVLCT